MHKTAIIICVDNDTCAYINEKLYAGDLKYISFDAVQGGKPHLLYSVDERIHDNGAEVKSFLYLLGCILQGWDSVENSQSKDCTWLEALKQMPADLFADVAFAMCQEEKNKEGFKTRLLEKFPEEIAPALHLIKTGAISLIPGYTPAGNNSSHLDEDI